MRFQQIKLEFLDEVARVTLARPAKLNAISRQMRSELMDALRTVEVEPKTRSLILRGAGTRAFSTGEDLNEAASLKASGVKRWVGEWGDFLASFIRFPKPLVTSCQGYATGAGWQLFLVGDYRIASDDARFSMPEINVGLPSILGGAILTSMVGLGQVNRFLLGGETIDARQALNLRLVHEVLPGKELERRTREVAKALAGKPSEAVRLQKDWSSALQLEAFQKSIANAASIYGKAFASEDVKRRIELFTKPKVH